MKERSGGMERSGGFYEEKKTGRIDGRIIV